MKTTKNKANWNCCLYAFFAPLLIIVAIFAALGVTPFGDKSIVLSDANAYYMPFISYCKLIFQGKHGILFSFSQNIGGGIVATIWPYLLNPFSWIVAFFEYEQYPLAYSLGVMFMDGLYGLVMYLYLADRFGNQLSGILLSTVYALCGFNVTFMINTAFFCGGPLFLPLMALGLRKLQRGDSPILYMVSIAWSLILQLQMGFTVCMASVLFFLAESWMDSGVFKRCWLRYTLASVIGGLLGAIVWLPELMVLRGGRGALSIEDFSFTANASLLDFGSRLFTGAGSVSQIADGYPAVFCGILPIALSVLFFMDKEIERRKKTVYAVMLSIYALAFYIRFFTSVFQGFTHANWFNYRFSFVFTFLMLSMSMEELEHIERISIRQAVAAGLGILLISFLIFFKNYEFIDSAMPILDLALLAIMGGGFWLYKAKPEKAPSSVLLLLFCLCTFLQLYINGFICMKHVFAVWEYDRVNYESAIMKKTPLIHAIQQADLGFYRIEAEPELWDSYGNDSMVLGYNGVGYAGHTERRFVSVGLSKLGLDFYSGCWNSYDPGIPAAVDSILGIKYVVSDRDLSGEKAYIVRATLFGESLFENPFVLPISLVSGAGVSDVTLKDSDVFNNVNALWCAIAEQAGEVFIEEEDIRFTNHNITDAVTISYADIKREGEADGESDVIQKSALSDDENPYIEYQFISKKSGPVYLYNSAAIINDKGTLEDVLQYVGYYREGDEVVSKLYQNRLITKSSMADTLKGLHICYADMDLLKEYSDLIRSRSTTIVKESDSRLSGEATLEEGQRLLFTIPFDEGWTLTVDGEEVPLEKTADLFMSASLGAGTHHYELVFWPVGLTAGIAVSIFALLGLIALSIISKNHRKNHYVTETSDGKPADGIVPELDQESPKRDTTETTEPDGSSTESA